MKLRLFCAAAVILAAGAATADVPGLKRDFTYREGDGFVEVLKDGAVTAKYVYKDTPRPYIYPLLAPNGEQVTRAYPMKEVAGEPKDHPHHRSFWIAFGDVNGLDFWADGESKGVIKQTSIDFEPPSPGYWGIHTTNDWVGPDGKKVCEDERRVSFLSTDYGTLVSTMLVVKASEGDLKLGDTKEGFFALRLARELQLAGGTGRILNSEGHKDAECWGKRARWCDYTGKVNGKTIGVAIFDSPMNYNHPTYWHVRDYGLFAANPFGGEDFTRDPEENGTITIPRHRSLLFLYSVLIHEGELDAAALDAIADAVVGKGPRAPTTEPAAVNGSTAPEPPPAWAPLPDARRKSKEQPAVDDSR